MGPPQGAARVTAQVIRNSKLLECSCGGKQFKEILIFKKISAIISPSGNEELFPMNIVVCTNCGFVPKSLNPNGIIPEEFLRKEIKL